MQITPIVVVGSVKLRLKFLIIEIPPNPLPNFAIDAINTSLLTTFMLGATTFPTPMVVIHAPSD